MKDIFLVILLSCISAIGAICQTEVLALRKAVYEEEVNGDLQVAMSQYEKIILDNENDRAVIAEALWRLATCHEKLHSGMAADYYARILSDFPDQLNFTSWARSRLEILERADSKGVETTPAGSFLTTRKVYSTEDFYGTVSHDGRYFSYSNWTNGNLAVYDRINHQSWDLTQTSWSDGQWSDRSIWSQDSKTIAYCWVIDDVGTQIRLYHLETGEIRELTRVYENVMLWPLEWTHNDQYILATLFDQIIRRMQIVLVSVDDGSLALVQQRPKGSGCSDCSIVICQDGEHIVYDRKGDHGQSDIYMMSVDGSNIRPLIQNPSRKKVASWLNDHSGFLYYSDISGNDALWKAILDDNLQIADTELLIDGITTDYHPVGLTHDNKYYYLQKGFVGELFLLDFDTVSFTFGAPQMIPTQNPLARTTPVWSPDGARLAYFRSGKNANTEHFIEILDMETSTETPVHPDIERVEGFQGSEGWPQWTDDGDHILLTHFGDTSFDIVLIDITSGAHDLITRGYYPKAKAADESLYFVELDSNAEHVVWLNYGLSESRRVYTSYDHNILNVALSRDGLHLAMIRRLREHDDVFSDLVVIPIAGGEPQILWESDTARQLFVDAGLNWCHDNRSIMFATSDCNNPEQQLHLVDFITTATQKLGEPIRGTNHFMRSIHIHPKLNRLAFSRSRRIDNIWALENF